MTKKKHDDAMQTLRKASEQAREAQRKRDADDYSAENRTSNNLKTVLAVVPPGTVISRAHVGPDDFILIESENSVSEEQAERMKDYLKMYFPSTRVLVLTDGLKFRLIRDLKYKLVADD